MKLLDQVQREIDKLYSSISSKGEKAEEEVLNSK